MSVAPTVAESSSQPAPAKPRPRWYQFTLRTLLFSMLILSLLLGGFAWRKQRAGKQAEAVASLRGLRCSVLYDYEVEAIKRQSTKWPPDSGWPSFLVKGLGQDFFHNVNAVNTGDQTPSSEERIRFWDSVDRLSKLHQLVLSKGWMDHEGLTRLRHPQKLEILVIASCLVTDDDLKVVGSMTGLKTLQIYGLDYPITDEGIAALDDLSELETLLLGSSKITDDSAPHLAKHRKLANLQIVANHLTDKSTPWLGQLTEMFQLSISEMAIGDAGAGNLKNLTKLEYLRADGTQITDEGLVNLAHLTSLQSLSVRRTKVTREGIARFKAQLPACTVSQ